jgi:hypothetical protein
MITLYLFNLKTPLYEKAAKASLQLALNISLSALQTLLQNYKIIYHLSQKWFNQIMQVS